MILAGGLGAIHDTGPPTNSTNYTTLVILHGYVWHSGIFSRLIPLAEEYNTRVVLVNRRDYPGSTPYTDEERGGLPVISSETGQDPSSIADAKEKVLTYLQDRGSEVYDFLLELVRAGNVLPADRERKAGGIVIAGWSFGTVWMQAFLACAPSRTVDDIQLSKYVRRVVFYDPAYHILGYPYPVDAYNPLLDPTLSREEKVHAFNKWVSGYFRHGDSPTTLERRTPLTDPPPTISQLNPDELTAYTYPPAGEESGSDERLLRAAGKTGAIDVLRKRALFSGNEDEWRDVEVCLVWCQQSVWEVPWGVWDLQAELEEAKARGLPARYVRIVRVRNGNHFIHWDHPEWTLRALVGDEHDI